MLQFTLELKIIMKKLLLIQLGALLLFAAWPHVLNAHHTWQFPDVNYSHPNFTAIEYLRQRHMSLNYKDGTFRPDKDINYAQLIVMIIKAKKLNPYLNQYSNCFADVTNQWFADEVCYAKSKGWLKDFGTKFYPENKATATKTYEIISRAFGDSNIYIGFDYGGGITRGEVAQMLYQRVLLAGLYIPPLAVSSTQTQNTSAYAYTINAYNVKVPAGYPQPWKP